MVTPADSLAEAPADPPADVVRYVHDLAAVLADTQPDLVGVYLHGSAVLGGFNPGSSDVDVLAVVAEAGTAESQRRTADRIAGTVERCPGAGLELSVLTAATAADLRDCPFELHVATASGRPTVALGSGHPGDRDLILHSAVCRQRGLAVTGPPPGEVFAEVDRIRVLAALVAELGWALERGSAPYAVLNACRALRFAADGQLCSKIDGGHWYLTGHPGQPVVQRALAAHRRGNKVPLDTAATRFVSAARGRLAEVASTR